MSEDKKKTRGPSYDREFLANKISMMRIKGKSTYFILEFLIEEVGMSRKIAYEVLAEAQKRIVEIQKVDMDTAFNEAIAKLEDLYENAEPKLRLEIQKEINKLRGLYSAEKIDVSIDFKAKFPGL
jgi:hypothetical protein